MAYTPSMTRLIQELSKLPGIGEKTAARLAFYVLRADRALADGLAAALVALKDQTRLCSVCNGLTESDPCPICGNGERSDESIWVVEEPADRIAHGIPMGGDVEYADVVTLGRALDGRRDM